MKYIAVFLLLFSFSAPAFAVGTIIATALALKGIAAAIVSFAINMVVSAVLSKAFLTQTNYGASGESPNPGNRTQVPPATDNKLPVVYGSAWVGGIVTDLSITANNQVLYYCLALSEVTGGGTDTITFGDIYYGGKKVVFNGTNQYVVDYLIDEATGEQKQINGYIEIYLYQNGSNNPANSTQGAISVMNDPDLTYKWDGQKLMTNCAFAIIKLKYNQDLNVTALEQTRFQITNSRYKPGECFYDYLTNTVYGAAIPAAQIDTVSLNTLDTYCQGSFTYTPYGGGTATQARFRFDGLLDTNQSIMDNMQSMANCCDCLIKYNEIEGKWGVITQSPSYSVAMALTDSNMVSAISITPMDLASSYNVIECKFPDKSSQDSFNSSTFNLAEIAPSLLFPNEPVNKQSVSLPLVNDSVRAQYIANRMLKANREDLQVQVNIDYRGIQLEAGDVVTVTSTNYGWTAKEFRIIKVIEEFAEDASITAKLTLSEFNASIYDDISVTEFTPAPSTGIAAPNVFGSVPAPVVSAQYPTADVPSFVISSTSSSAGIIQYAEIWYSAFSSPTSDQRIFAGTTAIQSNGNPYAPSTSLPTVLLSTIPYGNWYFFSRMVNELGTSQFSAASSLFRWRPATFQYVERYLAIAYADDVSGATNFSFNPRSRLYYGLRNQDDLNLSTDPNDYTWYFAEPTFGTSVYLLFSNRNSRKFSFDTGFAEHSAGTGRFVPSQTSIFDQTIWGALEDGTNIIDLDFATGQLLSTGTTTVGTGEIQVTNNTNGQVVASLKQFLDFGTGILTKTSSVANLTIDIYGRVVGFEVPDDFYISITSFTATSGQTVFSVSRGTGYLVDQCFVFQNGCLLDESEYVDASSSVTLAVGATVNDTITIVSFRSYNATSGYYASFARTTASLTNATTYTPSPAIPSGYELLFINGTILNEQDYDMVGAEITNFPANVTGTLTMIEWTANNLSVPNGTPTNVVANTLPGQSTYSFGYDANAFNLFENGILLKQGTDYTTATGSYTLASSPTTSSNILVQQTFSRTGAA